MAKVKKKARAQAPGRDVKHITDKSPRQTTAHISGQGNSQISLTAEPSPRILNRRFNLPNRTVTIEEDKLNDPTESDAHTSWDSP